MDYPKVEINSSSWHKENGLRITVFTDHDPDSRRGIMFTTDHAINLASSLLSACEKIEIEKADKLSVVKGLYLRVRRLLGYVKGGKLN